jgi:predicted acetyltransferase
MLVVQANEGHRLADVVTQNSAEEFGICRRQRASWSSSQGSHSVGLMASADFHTQPIDPTSATRMAKARLRMDILDNADEPAGNAWLQAAVRGFHGPWATPERQAEMRTANLLRRNTGVWDDVNTDKTEPVGTTNSWPTRLAIPGDRTIESWAISTVTVASTHAGKGIGRAMLEAELRTAATLGIPIAMLTVSESSLYQRYGFAPAAMAADYTFDARRVTWSGPVPDGRVEFTSLEQFRDTFAEMHERLVPTLVGEIDLWPLRVSQISGTSPDTDDEGRAKHLRALRYLDASGITLGIALYRVSGGDHDFTSHTLSVEYLITETPDAYAALWRYLLHVPLVEKVTAALRSIDEPVHWMITDWRAVEVKTWEHQYLRILDVATCLEARGYLTDGDIVFEVSDNLGFAGGRWALAVQDGVGRVEPAVDDNRAPALALGVAELSGMYLGGVRASTLVGAGRARELNRGAAAVAEGILRSASTPYLSIWY